MGYLRSMTDTDIVREFYEAFARCDGPAMSRLYADDVEFSDPVFPRLDGRDAGLMWEMLTSRAKDFRLTFSEPRMHSKLVVTDWEATYTFSATGRTVHNKVHSMISVDGSRIVSHFDQFSFWKWSRMALGTPGLLLGWTPLLKNKVRKTAAKGLADFTSRQKT